MQEDASVVFPVIFFFVWIVGIAIGAKLLSIVHKNINDPILDKAKEREVEKTKIKVFSAWELGMAQFSKQYREIFDEYVEKYFNFSSSVDTVEIEVLRSLDAFIVAKNSNSEINRVEAPFDKDKARSLTLGINNAMAGQGRWLKISFAIDKLGGVKAVVTYCLAFAKKLPLQIGIPTVAVFLLQVIVDGCLSFLLLKFD